MTSRRGRLLVVPAAVLALGAGLTACGGNGSASPQSGEALVQTATINGLGPVLVDGSGDTLYAYMPDRRGPSRCFGMCAHQWPPLELTAGQHRARAGSGVRASLLGSSRRGDRRQVTYNGWPLYTFINDAGPGEATGQAADMGAWYTVSTSGAIDRKALGGTRS